MSEVNQISVLKNKRKRSTHPFRKKRGESDFKFRGLGLNSSLFLSRLCVLFAVYCLVLCTKFAVQSVTAVMTWLLGTLDQAHWKSDQPACDSTVCASAISHTSYKSGGFKMLPASPMCHHRSAARCPPQRRVIWNYLRAHAEHAVDYGRGFSDFLILT